MGVGVEEDGLFHYDFDEDGNTCIKRKGKVLFNVCGKDCAKQAAAGLNSEFNPGWQSRNFLAQGTTRPEEVHDLLVKEDVEYGASKWGPEPVGPFTWEEACSINVSIEEAFRRGQKSK